jgi:ABC-type uncharacterized transport system permease subunit
MAWYSAMGAIIAYCVSACWIVWQWRAQKTSTAPLWLAWCAAALHTLYIGWLCAIQNGFSFGFLSVASLNILSIVLVLLLTAITKPVEKLGIMLFPMAASILGLDAVTNPAPHFLPIHTGGMAIHILASILAFSLLSVGAVQAILLAVQYSQLKRHPPKRLFLRLPSLQTMEALLFQLVGSGVVLLTLSLGTGFLFVHDVFAQHLAHKTILSMLAWLVFCAILIGRLRFGWRGRVAVNWIMAGFVLLLLGYFGSKLVLELILKRG